MMRRWILACALAAVAGAALATEGLPSAAPAVVEAPSATERLFAAAPAFNGTLAEQKIQASLRQKADMREGLEGEYFVFGRSQKILLAGEFDRDGTIFLEESEDGRSVSGQWDGKLDGDIFSGTWSSFDGSVKKPFALKIIPVKPRLPLRRMTRSTVTSGPLEN